MLKLKTHKKRALTALAVSTIFVSSGGVYAQAVTKDLIQTPDISFGLISTQSSNATAWQNGAVMNVGSTIKSLNLTGVQIGAAMDAGSMCRLRLSADVSNEQKHALVAAGCQITPNSFVTGGVSKAVERFDRYDTNLNGDGAFVRIDMVNLTPAVRKVFVEAITGRTYDKTLAIMDKAYQDVRTEDMPTFVRTITEKGVFQTTTLLIGGRYTTFGIGGDVNVGTNGLLTLKFSNTKFQLDGKSSTENNFQVGYNHYLSEPNLRAGVKLGTNGRVVVDAEKGLDNGWSVAAAAFKDTKNEKGAGIYARVNYAFGGTTPLFGTRPEQTKLQLDEAIRHMHTNTEYAIHNLLAIAKIKESTVKIKISETVVDVAKVIAPVVVVPPVVVPPVVVTPIVVAPGVDSPTTIKLAFDEASYNGESILATCNITDLDGVTGTCTVTRDDGLGNITSIDTRTITATAYSVPAFTGNVANVTYTLTLVGTKKVKNADNTFTTVNINQQVTFTIFPQ